MSFNAVKHRAWAVVALVLLSAPALQLAWTGSEALPPAPLAIALHHTLANDTVAINGSPSDQGLSLTGEVRMDYVVLVTVRVVVTSSTDLSWPANATPGEMNFTASGSQPFVVGLVVPAGTYNRSATLTVRAEATISGVPADTSTDTASIVVGGPSEGDGGGTGTVPKPTGGDTPVQVPNLPLMAAAVAMLAVVITGISLFLWKARRVPKAAAAPKRPKERNRP